MMPESERYARAHEAAAKRNPRKAAEHRKAAAILRGAPALKFRLASYKATPGPKVAPAFSSYQKGNRS